MTLTTDYYKRAKFLVSALKLTDCPADSGLEVAFAGRSNVGKSSALNVLTNNKSMARTSKTPGRTQMINFFVLDEMRRIVDLPGYGYAKVPENMKQNWQRHLSAYLKYRVSLQGLIVLMDIRRPLTELDQHMLAWSKYGLQVHALLTKSDKLKHGAAKNIYLQTRSRLMNDYPGVSVSMFSAVTKIGVDDLVAVLNTWLGR